MGHTDTRVHGTLAGVGMGPGHYELVTVQAADLLAAADVVFVLVTDHEDTGQAERLALFYAEAWRVERLALPEHGTAADPARAFAGPAESIVDWFTARPGGVAAVAMLGDPTVHSAFPRLATAVRERAPAVSTRLVPGIAPMQEASALAGEVLAGRGQSVAVLPAGVDGALLRTALRDFDTVVVNKVGERLSGLVEVLRESGRLAEAMLHSGGPFARPGVRRVADLTEGEPCRYLSTLVVLPRRGDGRPGQAGWGTP